MHGGLPEFPWAPVWGRWDPNTGPLASRCSPLPGLQSSACKLPSILGGKTLPSAKCFFCSASGVQPFGVSGPHWKKKSCLEPHIKYIMTHNHKKTHHVLSKFTIVCWATFMAILGCMWAAGRRLDTPSSLSSHTSVKWLAALTSMCGSEWRLEGEREFHGSVLG